ncbi:hypothetical protein [Qipengyuania sediminis]|uniref:hypothetical protein n=1 Tax=Qipengyuania sediminis TaxID=1532023 RepID=UPI00105A9176|nr:hypothetical protein [Qipengyuania sediminis]
MEHCHPSATTAHPNPQLARIDRAAAPLHPPAGPEPRARKPWRCTADYRWTQPKVIAFLETLSQCGQVAEAARAVGMSAWSAYRQGAEAIAANFERGRLADEKDRRGESLSTAEFADMCAYYDPTHATIRYRKPRDGD